ncbi:MAG: carbohydrate ABC transporter permease [Armatimonadetes bacterium]|nr:carbohydrate ABC transporter permease [Armatimonadota bacterium]
MVQVFVALAGVAVAFPFLWMVLTALKTLAEASAFPPTLLPSSPQWSNFREAWQRDPLFGQYFLNTGLVASIVTLVVMTTALLAGYAFGSLEFPGKRVLFALYLATMMIPFEVIMIPNFVTVARLGWYDHYAALIAPWSANVFAVFLLTQFFRTLPPDFFEAAQLDGCSHLQFLWRIGRPLAGPALATAGLFAFLGSWNSLLWPLLVTQSREMRTIEFGLSVFLQQEGTEPHLLMAASTIAMLPVLALFLVAQRTFVEGVSAGIKG